MKRRVLMAAKWNVLPGKQDAYQMPRSSTPSVHGNPMAQVKSSTTESPFVLLLYICTAAKLLQLYVRHVVIKSDSRCLEYTRLRAIIALCVRLAWSRLRNPVRGWLRATATFSAEVTGSSRTVVNCGDVNAIVPRDQIV
jgi:hypothetical protein